jgi:hypothetical protein
MRRGPFANGISAKRCKRPGRIEKLSCDASPSRNSAMHSVFATIFRRSPEQNSGTREQERRNEFEG